jgi:hypothetical protein
MHYSQQTNLADEKTIEESVINDNSDGQIKQ